MEQECSKEKGAEATKKQTIVAKTSEVACCAFWMQSYDYSNAKRNDSTPESNKCIEDIQSANNFQVFAHLF